MVDWEKNASFAADPGLKQAMLENGAKQRAAVWPPKAPPAERAAKALAKIERTRAAYVNYCNNHAGRPDPLVLREADKVISNLKAKAAN